MNAIKHVLLTSIILSKQVNASVPIEKNVIEDGDNKKSSVGVVTEERKSEINFQGIMWIGIGFGFGFPIASIMERQAIVPFLREFLNSSIENIIVINGVKAAIVVIIF